VRLDTVLPVKPPPGGTGWRSTPAISPSSAYGSFGVGPQSGACGQGLLVALSPGQWAPRLWSASFWDGGSPFPCGFLQEFYAVATWKLLQALELVPRLAHPMLRNQSADT